MSGLLIADHRVPIVPFVGMGKKKKQKGKGVTDNLGKALNYLKDTKLISNTMGLFPNEKAQAIANLAKQIGLGKKKKKQSGAGIFSDFGSGVGNIASGLGNGLGAAGFGIGKGLFGGKKKRAPKKKQTGAGIFSDFGSGIGNIASGLGNGLGAAGYGIGHGLFGGKKRGKKMINM